MSLVTEQTEIKAILEAVQVDASNVFHQVLTAPPESAAEYTGFPSAHFVYNSYESTYSTNEENRRVANWDIFIYSLTQTLDNEAHFTKMYKIIDATVQALDESCDLNNACDFVIPVPGEVDRVVSDSGVALVAQIRLQCWSDVDIRV